MGLSNEINPINDTPKTFYRQTTRQEELIYWFKTNKGSMAAAARSMNMTAPALLKLCEKNKIPTYRYEQLRSVGVPSTLLPPEHGYTPPGPKGKAK